MPPPDRPARAGLGLVALILGAFTCNINLAVANIALPDIGLQFGASQTMVNLVALGTTLGLAMSVLWFGAIGDRYGRKNMLVLGLVLTVPFSLLSAFAPSIEVLVAARILTGIAAGMAYPTTLALVTALWAEGAARAKAIALWSGISAGAAAIGPVLAGLLLTQFWWGSVFLIAVPPAVAGVVCVLLFVPAHVNESTGRVDNLGGVLSVVMIAALVLAISVIVAPGKLTQGLILFGITLVVGALFMWRQRRASNPLYDLAVAARRMFWVPAVAGLIVFGALMGAMFVGQQFMQNVLGYSTLGAGTAILPSAVGLVLVAPVSARLLIRLGARTTMLLGYVFVALAFIDMLALWHEGASYWPIGVAYLLVGIGAGLALTPASRSITGSTPVHRVGMASGTADLQRDLGGSIMMALLGALLTAGYATAFGNELAGASNPAVHEVTQQTQTALLASYSSAEKLAEQYPQYASSITGAARSAFVEGANWAYVAALVAVVVGAVVVRAFMPAKAGEDALLTQYAEES